MEEPETRDSHPDKQANQDTPITDQAANSWESYSLAVLDAFDG